MSEECVLLLLKQLTLIEQKIINIVGDMHCLIDDLHDVQKQLTQLKPNLYEHFAPQQSLLKVVKKITEETVNMVQNDTLDDFLQKQKRRDQHDKGK
jgi:hypothetical protein